MPAEERAEEAAQGASKSPGGELIETTRGKCMPPSKGFLFFFYVQISEYSENVAKFVLILMSIFVYMYVHLFMYFSSFSKS